MLYLYHNPRCRISREGLEYLKSKTNKFEVIEYIKEGLTEEAIKEILLKTNLQPQELVRTQEDYFKKQLKGLSFNTEEWIRVISENPTLLRRPIIVGKQRAVVADFPEKMDEIIKLNS